MTDRLIEVVEENPYEDWYGSSYAQQIRAASSRHIVGSPQTYDNWAAKERKTYAPESLHKYWDWITRKAAGENV